ncbi:MAG: phage tail tape measure protein, partial [Muribaculaceae bacterium]|nr:phage tail tape measure protein [Muribaculaceae bacterium]
EAAGNNEKKKAALEAQRDAEMAKTKSKYNDRAMKIEIAQALAQTAMNAIAAYGAGLQVGGMAGLILAPIAAAMATAAGMIQVATIKKQHEAQAAGYYSGGFTDRHPDNRREVGVVHANEFVANHRAVANPELRPVLSLIDRAQRANTVGSLTAADVSNAIGQGRGVSARGEVAAPAQAADPALAGSVAAMADTSAATRRAIDRLSDNLEGGIETYVVMDGERGLHKKLKHYERLIQNPKR